MTAGTSAVTATPDTGYLLSKVTINPTPSQTKTVTPGKSSKTVSPDSGKLLSKVTVKGDADLVAGNIKSGVNIFGVVGTLQESDVEWLETGSVNIHNYDRGTTLTLNHSDPTDVVLGNITTTASYCYAAYGTLASKQITSLQALSYGSDTKSYTSTISATGNTVTIGEIKFDITLNYVAYKLK